MDGPHSSLGPGGGIKLIRIECHCRCRLHVYKAQGVDLREVTVMASDVLKK